MKIYNLDEDTLLDETEGSTHAEGMEVQLNPQCPPNHKLCCCYF